MTLTNPELIQELEQRILTHQITLEIKPDRIKQCVWSEWTPVINLQTKDYTLNLTKLFEQVKTTNQQASSCSGANCRKTCFCWLTELLRQFNPHNQS